MKQKQTFIKKVDECSDVQFEINEVHIRNSMNPFKKIAFYLAKIDPSTYNLIHIMNFYKGGYPKENSPAKLEKFLDGFIKIFKWFAVIGWEDRITKYLKSKGITITFDTPIIEEPILMDFLQDKKDRRKFLASWNKVFPSQSDIHFKTTKEALLDLLDKSSQEQKVICDLSDSIKLDCAQEVEDTCEIKKSHFMRSVGIKYREKKDENSAQKAVTKIKKDIDDLEDAISIFRD